jgi:hypothetical protein
VPVIDAKERSPPKGAEPVEWRLLTSVPGEDFSHAWTVGQWDRARWEIELCFRVLKQGCQIEQVRLQTKPRWVNAIAVY